MKKGFHCGKIGLSMATLILLSGCAVGPDFKRPAPPASKAYSPEKKLGNVTASSQVRDGNAQRFDPKASIPFDWWTLFGSKALDSLIERAFRANPEIDSAQAALRQAQENTVAQEGFFLPTLGISYSPSRNKLAGNMGGNSPGVQGNGSVIQTYSNPAGPAPYNAPVYYNFHVAQLTVGYVPDVFGLNRRMVESAKAQENLQKFQLEATYITLASNVVAAAFAEASLRAQIDAMQKMVQINRELLDLSRKQMELGEISGVEVSSQESALASMEQALIPLQNRLEQTRDLIRALAGNAPDEDVVEKFRLEDLRLPETLPISLPSRIVEQRPDVRAAEEALHDASAQAGVAVANTLPQFAVTGAIGGMAATPGWMFKAGGGFFDLTANVAYTLFDGGTLRAKSRAAQQALLQAGAQYRSTVIAALQNVADTLHALQSDAETLRAAADGELAARNAFDLVKKQYETGAVGYMATLQAEQNLKLAEIALVQAQVGRLGDTAALYQALGGGWWNREQKNARSGAGQY